MEESHQQLNNIKSTWSTKINQLENQVSCSIVDLTMLSPYSIINGCIDTIKWWSKWNWNLCNPLILFWISHRSRIWMQKLLKTTKKSLQRTINCCLWHRQAKKKYIFYWYSIIKYFHSSWSLIKQSLGNYFFTESRSVCFQSNVTSVKSYLGNRSRLKTFMLD